MPITDVIRARSDHATKERAAAALADMGMSLSDAIRLLMLVGDAQPEQAYGVGYRHAHIG